METKQKIQQQSQEKKWNMIDNLISEVNMVSKLEDKSQSNQFNDIANKLQRLKDLNDQIVVHENMLKPEYLVLMRERNVYFEKLKMIQTLGEQYQWQDDSGLLDSVKQFLNSLGEQQQQQNQAQ